MIEKFIALKDVGKFDNYKAAGDVQLQPLTLIFGDNGRGKTTLCAVLRSLQTGNAQLISERKTLGTSNQPQVDILASGAKHSMSNENWSSPYPHIAVFDSAFVHENIFAGEYVDHEHRRNLHRIIVGKTGVQLAREIGAFDKDSRAFASEIRTRRAEIEALVPNGISFSVFLSLPQDPNVESAIKACELEVEKLKRAAEIKVAHGLQRLELPSLPPQFSAILEETVAHVALDAELLVRNHLRERTDGATESWLQAGAGFISNSNCPFCGTSIDDNLLVKAYLSYFGEAYLELKQKIISLQKLTNDAFSDMNIERLQTTARVNIERVSLWKQFVSLNEDVLKFPHDIEKAVSVYGQAVKTIVSEKASSPLELFTLENNAGFATEFAEAVQQYNLEVDATNLKIAEVKKSANSADLAKKQRELVQLMATKIRHEKGAEEKCSEYGALLSKKENVENQKSIRRKELDKHSKSIFGKYKNRINELLENFNTGFRIDALSSSYAGGHPSTSYQIVINDTAVNVGDSSTPEGTPAFRSTLSSGDRSTLALAFFLAQLEQDPDIREITVVFDDPFNSQDRFRRTCTQQLICEKAVEAKQAIVLSHDPYFLKLIWDNWPGSRPKSLQLTRAGKDNAVITEWDIEQETRASYFQDHAALTAYVHNGIGNARDVVRKIRPLLEGYLRVRFPSEFPNDRWLGDLIGAIRDADMSSPISCLKGEPFKNLENINDYSKKYHHEQNPGGADSEPLDDIELTGFVRRALRFVGGY